MPGMNRFNSVRVIADWVCPALLLAALTVGCLAQPSWPPAPRLAIPPETDAGTTPPSVHVEPTGDGRWHCTFRVQPGDDVRSVALAGTFNGWNAAAHPLEGPSNGTWTTAVPLPAGKHLYKFVLNGQRWIADPRNPDTVPDGHSGQNSVLRLGHVANLAASDAQLGDGKIEGRAIHHDLRSTRYFQWLAPGQALLRLRTLAADVQTVSVVTSTGARVEMSQIDGDPLHALWEAKANLPGAQEDVAERPKYTFVLADGDQRFSSPLDYGVPVSPQQIFRTPDWAKHAIWYQIFPERFRNGDPRNDPNPVLPWTQDWFSAASWEGHDGQTFYKEFVFHRFYGGDLQGVVQKLPYLRDLGVNAIYFNPVFKGQSNHKYDATNFLHIDDHFGVKGDYEAAASTENLNDPSTWKWTESDRLFLDFIRKAHSLGIRVILDGVFNHVGTAHPAFQDVQAKGQASQYADWFDVTSWEPFEYNGWAGVKSLPVFRKSPDGLASDAVKQHILNVTRRWMDPDGDGDPRDGIDGWRLDVPNEIPAPFWVEWRDVVKSVNPDAYITGEIWDRAELWLDGRHFDAVMNYEFAKATVAWIFNQKQKITPSEIDQRLRGLRIAYPHEATLVLQNLMNSHDTDRLASMAHNPDRAYDHGNRIQDNGPNYDNSKPSQSAYRKARLAALLQMTYVGAPMIYYGDEVGMWGADDPTCRKPMLWKDLEPYEKPEENHVMDEHLAYYRQIIALRNAHPALRTGSIQTLLADDQREVWAFLRKDTDEQLVVVLNASNHKHELTIPLPPSAPTAWVGQFNLDGAINAADRKLSLPVPAIGGVVLHAATPK